MIANLNKESHFIQMPTFRSSQTAVWEGFDQGLHENWIILVSQSRKPVFRSINESRILKQLIFQFDVLQVLENLLIA